jgi:hypothetical protein
MTDNNGLELGDLPVDVFDVADLGLSARSLTAGHGMSELGASTWMCGPLAKCSCYGTCGAVETTSEIQ